MGLIVLDTSVLIGFLDRNDRHHGGSLRAIHDVLSNGDELNVPLVAYAEVLVGANRQHGPRARPLLDGLLASLPAHVIDATRDIGAMAAALRARHSSLKLPDAFVLSTALAQGADCVVTADRRWPEVERIAIQLVAPDSD
jgi:predicted nucleic acid-binding protein